MFATVLLMTIALSGSDSPASPEARRAAADVLRSALAGRDEQESAPSQALLATAEKAAKALGPSLLAVELRQAAGETPAPEAEDRNPPAPRLEDTLRRVLADLEFEPILEAGLPEGFPAPTPVGEVELKQYPLYRVARADSRGNAAFWQLFMHIKKHDIPMTAPVEMTCDADGDELDMAFMYEHAAQGSLGQDGTVEVVDIAPMLVASLGCRGPASEAAVKAAHERLAAWIGDRGDLEVAGPPRRFGYNGPSVPASRRYFEVQVPVRRIAPEGASGGVDRVED